MDQAIENFLQGKRLAIVGVSRGGKKFGNAIYTELKQRGLELYIVHPEAKEIDGQPCYADLTELAGKVDGVVISVAPNKAVDALRQAASAGIQNIWLQQGADSLETKKAAAELGLTPITGKCILMYAPPVTSIHGFHRTVARIFGQL